MELGVTVALFGGVVAPGELDFGGRAGVAFAALLGVLDALNLAVHVRVLVDEGVEGEGETVEASVDGPPLGCAEVDGIVDLVVVRPVAGFIVVGW